MDPGEMYNFFSDFFATADMSNVDIDRDGLQELFYFIDITQSGKISKSEL